MTVQQFKPSGRAPSPSRQVGLPSGAEQAVQQLLGSPRLPEAMRRLQAAMRAEARKRRYFYEVVTEHQKAEFINGEIVVHTPVKYQHNQASFRLASLMNAYVQRHSLGAVGHEKLLVTLTRNDYEPDICFFGVEKASGFTPDQTRFPAPDMVVEVTSESTEAIDRGVKFEDYAAHGVSEYWLVDPTAETIEQYILAESGYELAVKVRTGSIASTVVNGFEIPVRAVFDDKEHLAALQAILAG